jgi:hypothetical protein
MRCVITLMDLGSVTLGDFIEHTYKAQGILCTRELVTSEYFLLLETVQGLSR